MSAAHVFVTDDLGRTVPAHTDHLSLGEADRSPSVQAKVGAEDPSTNIEVWITPEYSADSKVPDKLVVEYRIDNKPWVEEEYGNV